MLIQSPEADFCFIAVQRTTENIGSLTGTALELAGKLAVNDREKVQHKR
jgi:hypothetical protein